MRWFWFAQIALAMFLPLALKAPRLESGHWGAEEELQWEQADEEDGGSGEGVSVRLGPCMPKGPLLGQLRPPCTGAIEIHGGCWLKHGASPLACPDFAYPWRGGCYVPIHSELR
jgi:hypothetical protein